MEPRALFLWFGKLTETNFLKPHFFLEGWQNQEHWNSMYSGTEVNQLNKTSNKSSKKNTRANLIVITEFNDVKWQS